MPGTDSDRGLRDGIVGLIAVVVILVGLVVVGVVLFGGDDSDTAGVETASTTTPLGCEANVPLQPLGGMKDRLACTEIELIKMICPALDASAPLRRSEDSIPGGIILEATWFNGSGRKLGTISYAPDSFVKGSVVSAYCAVINPNRPEYGQQRVSLDKEDWAILASPGDVLPPALGGPPLPVVPEPAPPPAPTRTPTVDDPRPVPDEPSLGSDLDRGQIEADEEYPPGNCGPRSCTMPDGLSSVRCKTQPSISRWCSESWVDATGRTIDPSTY